jgi:uncharacterized protein
MSAESPVQDNPAEHRFEVRVDGTLAFLAYRDRPDGARVFVHTDVPPSIEGHGVGSRLVTAALDDARRAGRHVVPQCPFVAGFIERHPEYASLTH